MDKKTSIKFIVMSYVALVFFFMAVFPPSMQSQGNRIMSHDSKYPEFPGFQSHSDTSAAAADSVQASAKTKREKIMEFMHSDLGRGIGLTIDEAAIYLAKITGHNVQTGTASARMRELELLGFIRKSEQTRQTRAGKRARVYFVINRG